MKLLNLFAASLLALVALSGASAEAANITIGKVSIDNMGSDKRLLRLNDKGMFVDFTTMYVDVTVNFLVEGLTGNRILCEVGMLSEDGEIMADTQGEATTMEAFTVTTDSFYGKINVPLPYMWLINEETRKNNAVRMIVRMMNLGDEECMAQKDVRLTGNEINIDKRKLAGSMMGGMLGGGSGGGGLLGGILGSLLDSSDGEITEDCPSCDGTGICAYCDGLGLFDPHECRKCINDPGVCRRCKGEGTVTVKYDIY